MDKDTHYKNPIREALLKAVQGRLQETGETAASLADRSGISKQQLSHIMNNRRAPISDQWHTLLDASEYTFMLVPKENIEAHENLNKLFQEAKN